MIETDHSFAGCPLCAARETEVFVTAQGTDILHGTVYRALRCCNCGLIYLDGRVKKEEYGRLDTGAFYQVRPDLFHWFFSLYVRSLMFLRRRAMSRAQSSGHSRLLDVGCGEGNFLKAMQSAGWQCCGADISSEAVRCAADALGNSRMFCGDILDCDFPAASFDLITFWHSFEHFGDPAAVLRKVSGLLAPGGMLFISVPNVESIEARLCRKGWFGLELPRHQCTYTPAVLKRLLHSQGYEMVSITKNSLEYSIPMFMMTFYNWLGLENNWFYNFLKRNSYVRTNLLYRGLTIFVTLALLPFVLCLSGAAFIVHWITGNGSVIAVFARKGHG